MKLNRRNSRRALTVIEVLVIIAVVAVLVILLLPAPRGSYERTARSICINNLRQVGLAFRQWVIDAESRYVMGVPNKAGGTKEYIETGEVFRHFLAMSNDMNTPKILICPADKARKPITSFDLLLSNTNISYFVGADAAEYYPSMFLSGDRNLTNGTLLPNGILELTSNSIVGWTHEMHNRQGNIALSDGSVQSVSTGKLREALANTGFATNRLALPLD